MSCFLNSDIARTTLCLLLIFVDSTFGLRNFAIARPFSQDAPLLPNSFDVWSTYPPCREGGDDPPDLYLVYSQSFENNRTSIAKSAVQEVERMFEETSGWGDCFGQIHTLAVDIAPEEDLYKKYEIDTNVMWVNGPNRQFERTVRSLQGAGVEIFYLMEMDSVPTKPYWLDILVQEIKRQESEFAILGSKYRGDNWDTFFSQLPSALVKHLNGNAIYNLTSPFFGMLVDQLESEAVSVENSVAFDYRISQILEEAKFGTRPSFSPYLRATYPSTNLSEAIKKNANQIKAAVRETPVIGNYASTNIVSAYLDSREAIIHGAKLRTAWNKETLGDITLVVSDWHDGNSRFLLSELDGSEHPFDRVIVMTPDGTRPLDLKNLTMLPVQFIATQNRSNLDLCSAPVTTKWFMMTNSFHRIRKNLQLMTQYENGSLKPVVSFVKATLESCYSYPSCIKKLEMAKQILPSTDSIYQNNQFVFHTSTRDEFCALFEDVFSETLPPSATSYAAFLETQYPHNESLYVTFDKSRGGSRDLFLRLPYSMLPSSTMESTNSSNSNSTNSSETCTLYTSAETCASAYCEWRDTFDSCRYCYSLGSPLVTTQVQQLGQSGAFRISDGQIHDTNAVTVEVTSFVEMSANGTRADRNHGTSTFDNKDFLVIGPKEVSIEEVPAYKVTLYAVLQTQGNDAYSYGTIQLDVYILQENGTIGTDLERWNVTANDVKFNIVLQDWRPQPLSDFIDVSVAIKGKNDQSVESQTGNWNLGGGIPLSLSTRVQVDGSYEDMPEGYPKITDSIYTFRFPRFQSNVTYDPLVGYSGNALLCQGCRTPVRFVPSASPSASPTDGSLKPTHAPSSSPSMDPTLEPSSRPSSKPTLSLTSSPTPSASPTDGSLKPTHAPSSSPSMDPTLEPSSRPSSKPTLSLTSSPTPVPTFPPSLFSSEFPSSASNTQSPAPTHKANKLAPTKPSAPTTNSPSTQAPVVLQTNQASQSDNSSSQDRPAWVTSVTGGILAIGAVLFILMIIKSFPVVPTNESSRRGMRRRETASLNVQPGPSGEEMNSLDSIEDFSSLESIDLYETYLAEAGHFQEVESGIELVR